MALQPPMSVDVQDIQFKLHDKHVIFSEGELHNNLSLLSVASNQGLLFAGNPNVPELKVFILNDLVESHVLGKRPLVRTVPLPSEPTTLACSADGAMLAINYTMNSTNILQIYSIPSFTKSQLTSLYSLRLSSEDYVMALQLLWNPVLTNMLAVVHDNGALSLYTFKEGGQFELHSLEKSQNVQCGCWSPKGKQIVLGFANGKLQQFKPDLTPAKTIVCPPNIHAGPFDTLAVHWLSTFQFAVVYAQQDNPCIYIVNAPKGGTPNYTIFYDICYSGQGPRANQYNFTHIPQWNLLLICSANGVEIGVLATKDTGDSPKWQQYVLLDEARIELPLTESKDETYPIGFTLDTAATHQLVLGEQQLPIMPMVHVLSTHGHLVSFNFLNLNQNAANICSPPLPVNDESGEFYELPDCENIQVNNNNSMNNTVQENVITPAPPATQPSDMTFNFNPSNTSTSTPSVKEKTTSFFGASAPGSGFFSQPAAVSATTPFGTNATTKPPLAGNTGFGSTSNATFGAVQAPDFAGFSLTKSATQNTVTSSTDSGNVVTSEKPKDLSKPLYTVPPNFEPPPPTTTTVNVEPLNSSEKLAAPRSQINDDEITEVVRQMIDVQIEAFNAEIKHMSKAFSNININGNLDEVKQYTRRLNDLQEIIEQANDREFEADVQNLRHALSESYAMVAEFRSKLEQYNKPEITPLANMTNFEAINRRQVAKLQSYLSANEAQLQQIQLQIDTQWSNFQEIIRRNSKSKMHIPCLDGIYQRLTKLKDLVARQRTRINYIHTKLKQQGFNLNFNGNDISSNVSDITHANKKVDNIAMDSLTDSILSLSISQAVQENRAKLSPKKLSGIRNILEKRQSIMLIKPRRPDRVDLNSEVILETKLRSDQRRQRVLREGATASLDKMQQQQPLNSNNTTFTSSYAFGNSNETTALKKPTATKPATAAPALLAPNSSATTATSKPFSFAAGSSFVKPTAVAAPTQNKVEMEPAQAAKPASFGNFSASMNFSLPKGTSVSAVPSSEAKSAAAPTPISFAAKVIGGDAAKTTNTQPSFKPDNASLSGFAALSNANSAVTLDKKTDDGNKPAANTQAPPTFGSFLSKTSGAPSFNFANQAATSTTQSAMSKPAFAGFASSNSSAEAFSGFGKAIGELATLSSTLSGTTATTTIVTTGGNTLAFGNQSTTATNSVTITKTTTTAATAENTDQSKEPAVSDNLFAGLNICKPTAKEGNVEKSTENLFAGNKFAFAAKNDASEKTLFGGTPTAATSAASSFSFSNALGALAQNAAATDLTKTTTTTSSSLAITKTSTTATPSDISAKVNTSSPSVFGSTATTVRSASGSITTGFSGFGSMGNSLPEAASANVFGGSLATSTDNSKIQTATATTSAVPSTTATATSNTTSVFGGAASFLNSTAPSVATTNAPFAATTSTTTGNIFAAAAAALATTTAATTTTSSSIFGTAATAASPIAVSGGGLFSSMPKPEQSVFGSSTAQPAGAGIFAAAAQTTSPPAFGTPTANNNAGGSVFAGFGSPAPANNNIFGAPAAVTSPATGFGANTNATAPAGSIFSGAAKPAEGGNLFGTTSPTAAANTNNGGTLFGQSAFGQPSTFGNNFFATQQAGTGFGAPASIFGGSNQNTGASSGSIFGGGSSAGGGGTFGGGSTGGFGSPTNAAGSFAQGGASVAQTGFGSPQAASAFAKPVFGGAAAFGSPPAFNAQPSFGGAPTFGSPKGFGTFNAPAAVAPQTSPFGGGAPKDSIFETLGSSETPLSFGNLAQNTNANAPKPAFGGSSFMNYRA